MFLEQTGAAPASLHYCDGVHWATVITSTGALLGGLAIVLAFVQLGAQREDRLRGQVSKAGIWTRTDGEPLTQAPEAEEWKITAFVRNASELPVQVDIVRLVVQQRGYQDLSEHEMAAGVPVINPQSGAAMSVYWVPGAIAPGDTWHGERTYPPKERGPAYITFDHPLPPNVSIQAVEIADAAGHRWDVRPRQGGRPRRIHPKRKWLWRRGAKRK